MSVKMRQEVERKIAAAVIADALVAGYVISVDNGDEETKPMADFQLIIDAMFMTDEDRLYIWKAGQRFGWVSFIYGNDGWDVINDYTVNLESIMGTANKICTLLDNNRERDDE